MRLSQGGFHRFSENVCEFCCTSSFYQLCKETGDERGMDLTEEIKTIILNHGLTVHYLN